MVAIGRYIEDEKRGAVIRP